MKSLFSVTSNGLLSSPPLENAVVGGDVFAEPTFDGILLLLILFALFKAAPEAASELKLLAMLAGDDPFELASRVASDWDEIGAVADDSKDKNCVFSMLELN